MLWFLLVPLSLITFNCFPWVRDFFKKKPDSDGHWDRRDSWAWARGIFGRMLFNTALFLTTLLLCFIAGRMTSLLFDRTWVYTGPNDQLVAAWTDTPSPYLKKCFDSSNNEYYCYYYKQQKGSTAYGSIQVSGRSWREDDDNIYEEDRADYTASFYEYKFTNPIFPWVAIADDVLYRRTDLHVPNGTVKLVESEKTQK